MDQLVERLGDLAIAHTGKHPLTHESVTVSNGLLPYPRNVQTLDFGKVAARVKDIGPSEALLERGVRRTGAADCAVFTNLSKNFYVLDTVIQGKRSQVL